MNCLICQSYLPDEGKVLVTCESCNSLYRVHKSHGMIFFVPLVITPTKKTDRRIIKQHK